MEGIGNRLASGLSRVARPAAVRWALMVVCTGSILSSPHVFGAWDAGRMQQAAGLQGPRAERAVAELRDLIVRLQTVDDAAKVDAVNSFVNRRVQFGEDLRVWGQADHWASPLEALGRGQGDCEDYAVAKYFSLRAAGVAISRMRLVYVRAMLPATPDREASAQAHMVLAYYPEGGAEPMILDNLVPDVRLASRRPDLTPVFSFNAEGLWNGTAGHSVGDPLARLSRWREVLRKARAEGFE